MRGLTLWQPWAAAIPLGHKKNETRSWGTKYRGMVAIHSAKIWGWEQKEAANRLGLLVGAVGSAYAYFLPGTGPERQRGVVVAVANLVDCVEMTDDMISEQTELEVAFGDWRAGRFAWILRHVQPLPNPYPITGRQGLWKIKPKQEQSIMLLAGSVGA